MELAKSIVFGIAVLLAIVTLLPLVKSHYWWIRSWDFPRAQLLVFNIIVIAAILILPQPVDSIDTAVIAILGVATIYQATLIFKYTPFAKAQSRRTRPTDERRLIRILVSNIRMANRDYGRTLELIHNSDPDLILVVEPDEGWASAISSIKKEYPFAIENPRDDTYGLCLYSRFKLIEPETRFLVKEFVPSIHTWVELLSGERIEVYGMHPMPPVPGTDSDERDAEILIVGKELRRSGSPCIVMGDLNDVAWSHTTRLFQRVSRTLDPRVGRGFFNTYNAFIPVFRFPLDHIFYTTHFQLVKLKRMPKIGSDHFPILAELAYIPEEAHTQKAPRTKRSDMTEKEDKIHEGLDGD